MDNVRVKIWINAFIPEEMDGLTEIVPLGEYTGKTMIRGPVSVVNDCFLTDQRGFSDDSDASSRMHSLVEIECTEPSLVEENHRSDPTIEIDCEDGDEECKSSSSVSRLRIEEFSSSFVESATQIEFKFVGEGSNSCFTWAPDIDWEISVIVNYYPNDKIIIEVDGEIDEFPAFEMYAQVNNGFTVDLFQEEPEVGNSPGNLLGWANRSVKAQEEIRL